MLHSTRLFPYFCCSQIKCPRLRRACHTLRAKFTLFNPLNLSNLSTVPRVGPTAVLSVSRALAVLTASAVLASVTLSVIAQTDEGPELKAPTKSISNPPRNNTRNIFNRDRRKRKRLVDHTNFQCRSQIRYQRRHLEVAKGKADNSAIYLRFGHPF